MLQFFSFRGFFGFPIFSQSGRPEAPARSALVLTLIWEVALQDGNLSAQNASIRNPDAPRRAPQEPNQKLFFVT